MSIHTMQKALLIKLAGVRAGGAALLAAAMTVIAAGAQAAPMTVTSVADFNAAIGSATTTTDTFSNDIDPGGVEITFDSGVVSTLAGGNLGHAHGDNRVRRQTFYGDVYGDGRFGALTLTWTFPMPVIGFVAEFGAEFGSVERLDVTIPGSGQFFDINTEIGGGDGVFGLVDIAAPFTQIQFSVQNSHISDFFLIDNLTFAAAPVGADVPEPGTLALFGLGLAGLALRRAAAVGPGRRQTA